MLLAAWAVGVASGCAGPAASSKKSLNRLLAERDFRQAEAELLAARDSEYGASNALLFDLDIAMVLHHAGKYRESARHFARAEARMEELYTKSVSRGTGGLLANENVKDYPGEKFERALAHLFHGLDYLFLGQLDEALVEVRRLESFLDEAARSAGGPQSFQDDAFGHYVAALLYEDAGKPDDMRISREAARRAYARYAERYGVPAPSFDFPGPPGQEGEIVFLHYNGVAPRKVSRASEGPDAAAPAGAKAAKRQAPGSGSVLGKAVGAIKGVAGGAKDVGGKVMGFVLRTAHPEYVQDHYAIAASELVLGDASYPTELVEDISAIAAGDLVDRLSLLKARSAFRGALKLVGEAATGVKTGGTEFADVRGWSTLPAQIRMTRLRLPPGAYSPQVRFTDAQGSVVHTQALKRIVVRRGKRTWVHHRTAS